MAVKKKNVELGFYVSFIRKNNSYNGKVIQKRENTVLVELSKEQAQQLDIETNLTVVNYKNCIGVNEHAAFY